MERFYAPPLSAIAGAPEDKPSPSVYTTPRQSIATSRSSIRTADVLEVSGETRKPAPKNDSVAPLQPSVPTKSRWSDDLTQVDAHGRDSPVVPYRQSNMSTVRDDDAMTNWGSVHSPVAAVHVRQARLNARSTYIQKDLREAEERSRNVPSFNDKSQPGEVVTVMLDTSSTTENRQLPGLERRDSVAKTLASKRHSSPRQFYRRVGDECLTFSGREKAHSRKMPPPAPLLLGGKKAVPAQPKKPSPLESPEAVYQLIQDQLRKLEELNEGEFENEGDRMELLEDLEREMAGQRNKWQSLHMTIHRDSISTVQTSSPSKGSRPPSMVAALSQEQSSQRFISPEGASSRKSSRLSGSRTRSRDDVLELIMEDNNSEVLLIPRPSPGSPSSSETDESYAEVENEQTSEDWNVGTSSMTSPRLWQRKSVVTAPNSFGLWKGSTGLRGVDEGSELPGLNLRPKIRKNLEPLTTESSRMWQREMWTSELNETSGLWQKRIPVQRQQPKKVAERPRTMRPPRRNRRLTQLPDILESPEPLDRRGTLGIFRFPTGEKSENATVQYRPSQPFMPMPMPGTMTTGVPIFHAILQARAQQLEAEEATSYLDDFDEFEDESGDNFDDCSDSEDAGDDFDETTLWEIADLLKSEDGPSRDSLLAAAFSPSERVDSSVLEAPVYDGQSDEESDEASIVDFEIASEYTPVRPLLWTHETYSKNTYLLGLSQPDTQVWNAYITETGEESRSRSHTNEILPSLPIYSTSLWVVPAKESMVEYSTGLWAKLSIRTRVDTKAPARVSDKVSPLWSKPSMAPKSPLDGLFSTTSRRSDYRTTSAEPAALHMSRAPRVTQEPLPQLTSTSLWFMSKSGTAVSHLPLQQPSRAGSPVEQAPKPRSVTSELLWAKPMAVPMDISEGLFDVRSKRADYRRTSQLPAALSMTRKPSIRREPIAALVSRELWNTRAIPKPTPTSGKPSLWIKPVTTAPVTPGLFKIDPERKVYRTTTAEPAALRMDRKPRIAQGPLQELESSSLWGSSQGSIELDWLTISSTRPRSPSIASVSTDSTASSPVSDVFSVKTNATKASSVAESTKKENKGLRSGWFGKNKKEKRVSAVPEVPEFPEGLVIKELDHVTPEKPARVPLRKLYHPDTVYPADWDAALREAVAASYPVKRTPPQKRSIPRVPPAEWDAQLYQAIQASRVQRQLTRITASPQEWSAALTTAIAASYPPSRTAQKADTDTSLWTRPAALSTEAPKGLWAATSTTVTALDTTSLPKLSIEETRPQRSRASSESIREASIVQVDSEFHAQRLWRRDHSASKGGFRAHARDWLEDTTKRRFSRRELRY
ncbi:hypothetical protein SLS62_004247 [Diatrype stigma]|uniref:Uncharacterized protein n=1 Tax=Diatrype stigma TaxID=117547 RepID=A0AAN9UTX2_9PEZI